MSSYFGEFCAFGAWLVLIYSFRKNKSDKILYLQVIASVLFGINYYFSGAYMGLFVIIFEIIRDILYIKHKNDLIIFLGMIPIYILILIFTYDGVLSIFAVMAGLCDGYSLIYKGDKLLLLSVITYMLWLIYDIYSYSYINIIMESLVIIFNLVRYLKGKRMVLLNRN